MYISALKIQYFLYSSLIAVSLTYAQTTYYVSSSTGSDSNNGTSASAPWKTWMNIYTHGSFSAGSKILVKCGDTIPGAMYITMNGTSGSPCLLATYGTGARPVMLGDFSKNTWTAVIGFSGYYKTYCPMGGLLSEEQWEYASSSWHALTLMNDIVPNRTTWLNSMPLGSIGPLNNQNDTIFIQRLTGQCLHLQLAVLSGME